MAFDPSQFGATPVQSSGAFNPASFGATPIQSGPPADAASHAFNPLNPNQQQNLANVTKGIHQGIMGNLPGVFVSAAKNYGTNVGHDFMNRGQNIINAVNGPSQTAQQGGSTTKVLGDIGSAGLQTAGNVAGMVGDFFGEALKPSVQFMADSLSNNPTFSKVANSGAGDAVVNAQQALQNWSDKHPQASKDLGSIINIASLFGGKEAAPEVTSVAGDMATNVASKAGDLMTSEPVQNFISRTVGQDAKAADLARIAEETSQKASSAAGKIVQGGTEDVIPAQRALANLDLSGVKSYKDLGAALDNKISEISKLQDTAAESAHPASVHPEDLTYQGHNYVRDAVGQLKDFYKSINDIPKLRQINALETKLETQGLTPKEVNDLARQHGRDLSGFNANGELSSGLSKQAAENTRKGLKGTARNLLGDSAFAQSDKQLADLQNTRDLVDKVTEQVNKLSQKVQKRGVLAKLGYGAGKVLDLTTGGFAKNFVNYFIPRGEGLKTLNALDLEKMLQKNLKAVQALNDSGISDADLTKKLQEIILNGPKQKALPEPGPGAIKSQVNTPIETPIKLHSEADLRSQKAAIKGYKKSTAK